MKRTPHLDVTQVNFTRFRTNRLSSFFRSTLLVIALAACAITCKNVPPAETQAGGAPLYSKEQIIFGLSMISNIDVGIEDTYANLQSFATESVKKILADTAAIRLIGKWDILWGPIVYSSNTSGKTVADNTMMLVRGTSPDTGKPLYVVAIAGTNEISPFGWLTEDFNVKDMCAWPAPGNNFKYDTTPASPDFCQDNSCISMGTTIGLNNLLSMTDKNVRLVDYLKANVGNLKNTDQIELAVAGHSLGGALAPTLALALIDNQSYWNPDKKITVSAWPTAGPTPGNSKFVDHAFTAFGNNFHGVWNSLDIVPHAWNDSLIQKIPHLYDGSISNTCIVQGIVNCVYPLSQNHDYQRFKNEYVFQGAWETTSKTDEVCLFLVSQRGKISNVCKVNGVPLCGKNSVYYEAALFFGQAGYQHVGAYTSYFRIEALHDINSRYFRHPDMVAAQKVAAEVLDKLTTCNPAL